jgi:hypothetical protein
MRQRGSRILEAEPAAERAWIAHVAEMAERTLFPKANSWYLGANIAVNLASSCPMSAKVPVQMRADRRAWLRRFSVVLT